MLSGIGRDLAQAVRTLRKNPAFAIAAVLTLTLGIGANTAIFSVVHALLWKPLPFREPERLVALARVNEKSTQPGYDLYWSYPEFQAIDRHARSFDRLAAYLEHDLVVGEPNAAEKLKIEYVTAGYFELLSISASHGRTFPTQEGQSESSPSVVLSYRLWQRRFGGDLGIVGRIVYLNGLPFAVAGLMPPGFGGQAGIADAWLPITSIAKVMSPDMLGGGMFGYHVLGRLKSRTPLEQARAELAALRGVIRAEAPTSLPGECKLVPLRETKVDPTVRHTFLLFLVAVGFLLLIACVNTAALWLSRGVARRKEFAVRTALGASRWRLRRLMLIESLLLSLVAGIAGLALGWSGVQFLIRLKPLNQVGFWSQYARTFDYFSMQPDATVWAFNFFIAMGAGVVFSLLPTRLAGETRLADALKTGNFGAGQDRGTWAPGFLVAGQIALCIIPLVGTGLALKSFAQMLREPLGFVPEGITTVSLDSEAVNPMFARAVLERLRQLPGVESASISSTVPFRGFASSAIVQAGIPREEQRKTRVLFNVVSPDYFEAFRIRIVRGRAFNEKDTAGSVRVALVNRAMAELFWPGRDPRGIRLETPWRAKYSGAPSEVEIIGVVENVKYSELEEPYQPTLYFCLWQPVLTAGTLAVRTTLHPTLLLPIIRDQVASLNRSVSVYGIQTMADRAAEVTSRQRYVAMLLGLFAALALLLAAIGIYGVITFVVSGRTHEMGIRLALGAQPLGVVRLVLRQAMTWAAVGLAVGLALATATTRYMESVLYGTSPLDPLAFGMVAALVLFVSLLAGWAPARRAGQVDPLQAIRHE